MSVEPGQSFGEMALLTGEPRSAQAVTTTEATLLELARADFDAWVGASPVVMREMLRIASEWQHGADAPLAGGVQNEEGKGGRLLVVFGTRGGCGKTTVAVNLAVALAQRF